MFMYTGGSLGLLVLTEPILPRLYHLYILTEDAAMPTCRLVSTHRFNGLMDRCPRRVHCIRASMLYAWCADCRCVAFCLAVAVVRVL